MTVTIFEDSLEESRNALARYASIPSIITVREVLEVRTPSQGLGGFVLDRRPVSVPYRKDYDAPPALAPVAWSERFDVSHWGLLTAKLGGKDVGKAAIACRSADRDLFDERDDLAVLWDLRVHPAVQRQRVGAALFEASAVWARARDARYMKIETQNVNVPACLFYAAQGCELGAIHRFAYPHLPFEAQILWYKTL